MHNLVPGNNLPCLNQGNLQTRGRGKCDMCSHELAVEKVDLVIHKFNFVGTTVHSKVV